MRAAGKDLKQSLSSAGIEIVEIKSKRELLDFIELPLSLYRNDPLYSPQLTHDLKVHFSDKNPFFKDADVDFFLALKHGKIAGRIVAIVNHLHLRVWKDATGFFGFFESINDKDVSRALLDAVYGRLMEKGMTIMRGPMNFSTNEECGFLIDGFGESPMLMMPYNPPYYNDKRSACIYISYERGTARKGSESRGHCRKERH